MMSTRKRAVALDSSNSGQPMAKRVCHQWLPQSSPAQIQTMVDSLGDPSRSLTPLPLSTTTSSSPPASPVPQCSNKPELLLSASPSSSSDCLSQSLSPASLLSSLTPSSSSSPPTATTVSSPSIAQKTPSPDAVEGLPVFSPDDTSTEEARLAARYQDDFRRVWSSSVVMLQATVGVYELITRLGIWTGDSKDFGVLARAHPELAQVLYRTRETGDLREIFAHREFIVHLQSFRRLTLLVAAFHNSLNTVINSVIDCVSYIFTAIRGGALPSLSFLHHAGVESRNISYLHDLSDPSTSSSIKIADELMNTKRSVPILHETQEQRTERLAEATSQRHRQERPASLSKVFFSTGAFISHSPRPPLETKPGFLQVHRTLRLRSKRSPGYELRPPAGAPISLALWTESSMPFTSLESSSFIIFWTASHQLSQKVKPAKNGSTSNLRHRAHRRASISSRLYSRVS